MKTDPRYNDRIVIAKKLGWKQTDNHWISPEGIRYDWTLKRAFNPWRSGTDDAYILRRFINVLYKGQQRRFFLAVEKRWTYHSITGAPRWCKYSVGDYADAFLKAIS